MNIKEILNDRLASLKNRMNTKLKDIDYFLNTLETRQQQLKVDMLETEALIKEYQILKAEVDKM